MWVIIFTMPKGDFCFTRDKGSQEDGKDDNESVKHSLYALLLCAKETNQEE